MAWQDGIKKQKKLSLTLDLMKVVLDIAKSTICKFQLQFSQSNNYFFPAMSRFADVSYDLIKINSHFLFI